MVKWKLMVTTLPYVVTVLGLKLFLEKVLDFPGAVEFGEVGLVLTGGVFLIGFMLAGTMADYKESEKIPADLACTLETLEETYMQASIAKPEVDARATQRELLRLCDALMLWLFKKVGEGDIFESLEALGRAQHALERAGASGYASRALSELHNVRKMITRIRVISKTSFLASGYALLETLTVLILSLLLISRFKTQLAEIILICTVTLIYVYMVRLIKDIDDPFEYTSEGMKGAAEVELFPLEEYRARLQKRVMAVSQSKPAS